METNPFKMIENAFDSTVRITKSGIDHTIDGVKSGIDHTVDGMKSGVDHTVDGIASGVDHLADAVGIDTTLLKTGIYVIGGITVVVAGSRVYSMVTEARANGVQRKLATLNLEREIKQQVKKDLPKNKDVPQESELGGKS